MNDETAYPHSPGSTILSIIRGAADQDPNARRMQIERFVHQYGAPLKGHLVFRRGVERQQADDWLQDFLAEKLLTADPQRSLAWRFLEKRKSQPGVSFRAYLLRALNNYVIDRQRSRKNVARPMELAEPASERQDPDHFDRDWANNLLNQALEAVRDECERYGQVEIWRVFEMRVVAPARDGTESPSYDDLVRVLGVASPKQASNRLQTAIRKFNRHVRLLVGDYVPADASENVEDVIQNEIHDLRRILATPGAIQFAGDASVSQHESVSLLGPAFFDIDGHSDRLWTDGDLAQMWKHTLTLPIDQVLSDPSVHRGRTTPGEQSPPGTLGELLHHPSPPPELLVAIKDDAKLVVNLNDPTSSIHQTEPSPLPSPIPSKIGALMYVAAIALAQLRLDMRISRDSDDQFRRRLKSILRKPWIDPMTRELLDQWLAQIDG